MRSGTIAPYRYPLKLFLFEYLLCLASCLPLFVTLSPLYLLSLNTILWILKYRYEGFRMHAPLIFATMLLSLAGFTLLPAVLSLLLAVFTYNLKVYNLPFSKGAIGYKTLTHHDYIFSLFYPANTAINSSNIRLFSNDVGHRMFDIINKDPGKPSKFPKSVTLMATHYYTKMTMGNVVINSGPAIKDTTYELILISHQLGFNSLFSLAREFAQAGYIVVLVNHVEEIRNIDSDASSLPNKEFRTTQLRERYKAVSKALDLMMDEKEVCTLLGEHVKINKDRIHIMGHSFGATTALYSAIEDKRITGTVVCLDPCLYIMDDSLSLENKMLQFNNNTLILLAEDYYKVHYHFFENDFRVKTFRGNCKNVRVLRMLGTNHANFSQLSLFTSGQFHRFKVIRNSKTPLYFELFLALTYLILQEKELPSEAEMVEYLLANNPKYRGQISQTFRSILDEQHSRMVL